MMPEQKHDQIDQILKARILRRVRRVWFWRRVAPLLAVELVLILGVFAAVLTQVSLPRVLENAFQASSGARDFFQFFIDNFFVKSVQSQLLALLYVGLVMLFARDLRRSLKRLHGGFAAQVALAIRS